MKEKQIVPPATNPPWSLTPARVLVVLLAACLFLIAPSRSRAALAAAQAAVRTGNTNYFQRAYASAEANFTVAITNEPTWAVPYNNRGLARFHRGNFSGADADFDAAKSRETNYVSAYLNKGKSLAAQKRFTEAAAELEAALRLTNRNSTVHYNLGWVYDEQGRHAEARQQYDAALTLDPAEHRVRLARGISYARENLVTEAERDFYAVINGARGTLLEPIAAYNLQLLRGPGVAFPNASTASNFVEAAFTFSAGPLATALTRLQAARTNAPSVPDIPWITSWAQLRGHSAASATTQLTNAYALMEHVTIQSAGDSPYALSADVFLDGIKWGRAPGVLPVFAGGYDLALRTQVGTEFWEWTGRIQTKAAPDAPQPMCFRMVEVPASLTPFHPLADTDDDGLTDEWELRHFGSLAASPGDDLPDRDGLANLYEHWMSADPNDADSDHDAASDLAEFRASLLQIASLRVSGGACSIQIFGKRGFQYVVDFKEALPGAPWAELPGSRVTGNDSIVEVADVNPASGSTRFYRVRLDIPPQHPERLAWVPSGTFTMGSPVSEAVRNANYETRHQVRITRGFWMGRYEVTQGEYFEITGTNPSFFNGYQSLADTNYGTDLTRPVETVSWHEAWTYCALLTRRDRAAWRLPVGYVYRLPTEAEWEYACRAGTTTSHHCGNELRSGMANFDGRYEYDAAVGIIPTPLGTCLGQTVPVGSYQPNAWGLYDMHGNVGEWCYDRALARPTSASVTDPTGPTNGVDYVVRSGGFGSYGHACRSAARAGSWGGYQGAGLGFRVVLAAEGSAPLAPRIIDQPQSQVVSRGAPATIGVGVEYQLELPVTFQWFLNGTNLVGRTNSLLEISSVQLPDVGEYLVRVSNDYGFVISEPATLRLATGAAAAPPPRAETASR